jgi:hypothetical protein
MKKTYFAPEMETIDMLLDGMLCASIPGGEGGGDDGGSDVNPVDPSDPDWGSDY